MRLSYLLLAAALTASVRGQDPGRSPFMPPNALTGPGAGQQQGENYELAGVASGAEGSSICLYDRAAHRSRWINVGETDGDLQVISYDANADQAVVRFDGRTHVLSLRQARTAVASGASNIVIAPVPPPGSSLAANQPVVDPSAAGKSPEVLKQERDARMLVSDLLEISIRQRKAYQEAQQRAAKKGGTTSATH